MLLEDPELVGEFVQCLYILEVTRHSDPLLWPRLRQALAYLLDVERRRGSKGVWSKQGDKVYDRYHSSYCAVIGLMLFDLRQDDPQAPDTREQQRGGLLKDQPLINPRAFRQHFDVRLTDDH